MFRFGMAAKVNKGDKRTCDSKLTWMKAEMLRLGPAASAKLSWPDIDVDWKRADTKVGAVSTTALGTCESFSQVFQMPNADECKLHPMQTNQIYAVGGGGGSRFVWYHY